MSEHGILHVQTVREPKLSFSSPWHDAVRCVIEFALCHAICRASGMASGACVGRRHHGRYAPWIHIQSSHVSTIPAHCESKPICSTRHKMLWLSESASDEGRAVRGRERAATPAPVRSPFIRDPRHGTSPGGKEGRHQKHTAILPYLPIYLWEITEQVVHSRYVQLDSSPWPANGRRPTGGRDRRAVTAVGTYEGWVTSYGVCGHLLDSLSACDPLPLS